LKAGLHIIYAPQKSLFNIQMKRHILSVLLLILPGFLSAQNLIWDNAGHPFVREVYGVAFSADGSKVLSGSECTETRLRMWDVQTGSMLWEYQLDSNLMCTAGVKFSSNGNWLAALEEMGYLLMFDLSSGTPSLTYTVNTGTSGAFAVDFSPAGDKVVTGCTNNKMIIYDVTTGSQLHNVSAHLGYVFCVAWSHDGQFIATGGQDNTIKVWDSTGTLLSTLTGHTGDVYDVKFSADDNFLVSGSQDNSIKIWNRSTAQLVHTITGHTNDVRAVAISPDGNYILSGATDATTRIWNFNNYSQIASFNQTGAGNVYTVAWSPLENKVVTGTQNNKVLLWDINNLVGIQDVDGVQNAGIFPNPASNAITVISDGLPFPSRYDVFSLQGKVVLSGILNSEGRLDISLLDQGSYFIRIYGSNGPSVGRFVKVRD
jgi:WD40 repeat protein